jgi:hypothetical protein
MEETCLQNVHPVHIETEKIRQEAAEDVAHGTSDPDRGRMKLYFARRITLRGFLLAEKSHFFHDAKNDVRKLSHASGMPTFSNIEFAILVLTALDRYAQVIRNSGNKNCSGVEWNLLMPALSRKMSGK